MARNNIATRDSIVGDLGLFGVSDDGHMMLGTDLICWLKELLSHIEGDDGRWQSTLDMLVALEARIKKFVQDSIQGVTFPLNYAKPTLVMGNGGLVNLLDGQQWEATGNGAIVCASGGLLSVAYSVLKNGVSVWESPIYALGIKVGGDDSPSVEIPVQTGDIITASGLLSFGSPINVTYYPNKV